MRTTNVSRSTKYRIERRNRIGNSLFLRALRVLRGESSAFLRLWFRCRHSYIASSVLCVLFVSSQIHLGCEQTCLSMRREPCHHIGNLLRTHGPPRDIRAPVGHAQIGSSNDNRCAQSLIAGQSQVGRINHGPAFGTSAAIFTVALGAIGLVRSCAALSIAGTRAFGAGILETVRGKSYVVEIFALPHLDLIPSTSMSICLSVSGPPACCAKAGALVPGTPRAITARRVAALTRAR